MNESLLVPGWLGNPSLVMVEYLSYFLSKVKTSTDLGWISPLLPEYEPLPFLSCVLNFFSLLDLFH